MVIQRNDKEYAIMLTTFALEFIVNLIISGALFFVSNELNLAIGIYFILTLLGFIFYLKLQRVVKKLINL